MLIYLIMYTTIIVDIVCVKNTGKIEQRSGGIHLFLSFFVIVLILSLRHPSMGTDLSGYIDSFQKISEYSVKETINLNSFLNYEWGYVVYNKLLSVFTSDSQFLIIVTAIISIVPIGYLIKRRSSNYIFSTVVYLGLPVFMITYSGLRQAIAIGLCCFGILEIKDKHIIRFAFWVGLASLFHSSAVIFLIAYPLYHLKLNRIGRFLNIPLLLIIYLYRSQIFMMVSKFFRDKAVPDNNNSFVLLVVFVLIYLFCTIFINNDDSDTSGMLNIYFFACVCQCFAGVYNTAMRIGYYFMPALVIALPNIVSNMQNKKDRFIISISLQAMFIFYGLFSIYKSSWAMAYPYHFFWESLK